MSAIRNANSLDEVINAINSKEGVPYFGGTDIRSSHDMAGEYAWDAAKESGYTDNESIGSHLQYLIDEGARFEYEKAMKSALEYAQQEGQNENGMTPGC